MNFLLNAYKAIQRDIHANLLRTRRSASLHCENRPPSSSAKGPRSVVAIVCWSLAGIVLMTVILTFCMVVFGYGEGGTHDVDHLSVDKGIVKIGMSAHDVKRLLGPPLTVSSHTLTFSSATGTNAESTRSLTWVMETASPYLKRTVVNDLNFKKTHPWAELPGDPVSNYGKNDAGWKLETIRLRVISDRELKKWKQMEEEEVENP